MEINQINEEVSKLLNEDAFTDLKDDIANSKTMRNLKNSMSNVTKNIGKRIDNIKDKLDVRNTMKDIKHAIKRPNLNTEAGIEAEQEYLFDRYVPDEGASKTLGGELIRCLNRIEYRFYNDGDMFACGYGIETAAAAAAFIFHNVDSKEIKKVLDEMRCYYDSVPKYKDNLAKLKSLLIKYIKSNKLENKSTTKTLDDYDYITDNVEVMYGYYYSESDNMSMDDVRKNAYEYSDDIDETIDACVRDIESDYGQISDVNKDNFGCYSNNFSEGEEVGSVEAIISSDDEDEEDTTVYGTIVVTSVFLSDL